MEIIKNILLNGYIPLIPILLWNIFFTKYLPPAYNIKSFNTNIPKIISIGEFIGRFTIFSLPLFIKLEYLSTVGIFGIGLFITGVLIYFSSWIVLILYKESSWAKSLIGFTAPAYTIIIWLTGFAILSNSFYFKIPYSKWIFIIPSLIMTGFHFSHALYVWLREYR